MNDKSYSPKIQMKSVFCETPDGAWEPFVQDKNYKAFALKAK